MCLKSPKPQPAPVVQPAPTRDTVKAETVDARRRASTQRGVYGNIFTSPLGDSSYGASTASRGGVATFGA